MNREHVVEPKGSLITSGFDMDMRRFLAFIVEGILRLVSSPGSH